MPLRLGVGLLTSTAQGTPLWRFFPLSFPCMQSTFPLDCVDTVDFFVFLLSMAVSTHLACPELARRWVACCCWESKPPPPSFMVRAGKRAWKLDVYDSSVFRYIFVWNE
jgi:hypothetical protein